MSFYEGLYILDVQGKDEGLKEALTFIEKEIVSLSGQVKGTQKMDKKKFERVAGHLDSGYYVNVLFTLPPSQLDALQKRLKLNNLVYRQFYLRKEEAALAAV